MGIIMRVYGLRAWHAGGTYEARTAKKGKLKQLIEFRVWDIGSRVHGQGVLLSRF